MFQGSPGHFLGYIEGRDRSWKYSTHRTYMNECIHVQISARRMNSPRAKSPGPLEERRTLVRPFALWIICTKDDCGTAVLQHKAWCFHAIPKKKTLQNHTAIHNMSNIDTHQRHRTMTTRRRSRNECGTFTAKSRSESNVLLCLGGVPVSESVLGGALSERGRRVGGEI